MNKLFTENFRSAFGDSILAFLPFSIIFITIPTALFLGNINDFREDYLCLFPFLLLAGVSFLLLLYVFDNRTFRQREPITLFLFWVGIFLFLSDLCFPVLWDRKEGIHIFFEPWWQILAQSVLAGIVIWCAFRFSLTTLKKVFIPFVIILLIVNLGALFLKYLTKKRIIDTPPISHNQLIRRGQPADNAIGNIYHIIFDAYSSDEFSKVLDDIDIVTSLGGFTYFKNTFANYTETRLSLPSFFTGNFYTNGSLAKWRERFSTEGIFNMVTKAGWSVEQYIIEESYLWFEEEDSQEMVSRQILNISTIKLRYFRFMKFCSIRIAPVFLRREVKMLSDRVFGYLFYLLNPYVIVPHSLVEYKEGDISDFLTVPFFRFFIKQQLKKQEMGRYVFAHFLLPHSPFIWDSECNFVTQSSYSEQARCATKLIIEFIAMLKDKGQFDNALIIIQGDHGWDVAGSSPLTALEVPDDIMKKVNYFIKDTPPNVFLNIYRPLLLVKPPFSPTKKLVISEEQTQLVDIAATIYDILDIDVVTTEGQSVFTLHDTQGREIHMFIVKNYNPKKIGHISFTPNRGWHLYPDITVMEKK